MKDDDTLDAEKSLNTDTNNGTNDDVSHSTSKAPLVTPKKTSSGRGLYITAIVLGVIIVILLALYIFLALTHKKSSQTIPASLYANARISKGWTSTDESVILYPDINHMLTE